MIILFDYKKIMQPNTVVHCDTEEKAKKLLEWADSRGLKWNNGDSYKSVLNWHKYGKDTVYKLSSGLFGDEPWYKRNNYTVLTYEEAILNDYDLIYKIETGDFGNRCETVYCVDYKNYTKKYNKYTFDINKGWNGYVSGFDVIYIGSKKGSCPTTLIKDKTEILTAFRELANDRNWKVKVIYDGQECSYNYKTVPDKLDDMLE